LFHDRLDGQVGIGNRYVEISEGRWGAPLARRLDLNDQSRWRWHRGTLEMKAGDKSIRTASRPRSAMKYKR